MDVSIILVNYKTPDLTLAAIASIYEQTKGLEFEVIVVDNASGDGSVEAIRSAYPQITVIANAENYGFGTANNRGIDASSGRYLFLLNPDTLLLNNAIKHLVDTLDADASLAACGGSLENQHGEFVHSYGYFNTPSRHLLRLLGLRWLLPKNDAQRQGLHLVEQVIGADLLLRRSVLEVVGGFDERFFLYYEESELQWRIMQAGQGIAYQGAARILHYEGASTKQQKARRRRWISESEYRYFRLCFPQVPRFWIRCLCSWPQLGRLPFAPQPVCDTLRFIWTQH